MLRVLMVDFFDLFWFLAALKIEYCSYMRPFSILCIHFFQFSWDFRSFNFPGWFLGKSPLQFSTFCPFSCHCRPSAGCWQTEASPLCVIVTGGAAAGTSWHRAHLDKVSRATQTYVCSVLSQTCSFHHLMWGKRLNKTWVNVQDRYEKYKHENWLLTE